MTCKIKRRSLRCGGRPKADFGSIFTTFIAPALSVAGSVADSTISKTQVSKSNTKPAVKETNTEVTNNTSVENLPTIQVPTKDPISGLVTSNTVIPPDPTKTPTMKLGGRKKCWIGAAIGAATSIAGSLFGNGAKKREMRRQKSIQDWQNTTQEAANMTTALNNSQDYQEDYLRQFRTAARLGKTLGAKGIYITDGGGATKIGNNTYLLRGGSHEDVNETGQTGIGINVGGNEVEAEGGEVAQKKNGALRIFSAQPILGNGMSPAQVVMSGANKDRVFNAQQQFKRRNHLSDDGGKAKHGTEVPYKRIHINEDGTFTDTLTGKNYNTSATNGEDVVITGKANHWKEAGKKDTSSYFDPMGAVNFVTAAGAPILNANPSNIVGSIRDSKNAGEFLKHYMMQDTGGFVNTKWAKEHPYLSLGINTIGDIGLGYGLGKTGVGLYRLRPSNLRKHIFENISPIGYDKPISRIKEAFKSALSGAEADIDNPSWFNNKSAQDLNTYNVGITKNMFGPHALEARFDAWRKYLGLPQKFNTWTESPIVKGAYTDTKGISNLKVLPKDQSVDFINSAGGNVANDIEEFTTRGYNGQKYGVSHIRDTWDLQPWSRLRGNIIEDKVIRPLYNTTIGKANRKLSSSLHKFINKYGYDNEAIQKYLNENGEEALDNLSDVIEHFADTKSIKGKLAHKLSGLDDIVNNKGYYVINKNSKLSKLTNKLSDKIKNFEASSLLPGAKPFKIAYDIPWTNEVFPNNEMVKGFNMIDNLPTEAYRYKLKNPLLDYKYRFGGRCKLRNGGLTSKDRGSSKRPYPSVSSKDFAGGGRSYPIPTKADAVDALRLAGLHGRSDVRSKVYSKYPSLRKKSLLGSCNRPVKGMRPKAAIGIFVPYNKRYTSIYDAPDYDSDYNGGNVLGNGEVTVTAKRIKPTFMKPNNDAMNIINHPANETPYIPQRHNRSRTIFSGGDYLGLGIDTLAALSTGLVNYNTAGKYTLPDRAPIIQASKLPTTYNVNPEIEEVKRYRDRLTGQTFNNTSSSVAALNRSGAINLNALSNLSKLWATKENEENKMLTEDAKNQQTVAAQNVQNELARQSEIARIKNEATQAKGDALNVGLSGLSQAWTNFWTAGRTAYEDDQSRRAMIASSKDATPTRLMEMNFDLSPDIIAALYRTSNEDRTKRFYLSRLSPKQRQKYGIN